MKQFLSILTICILSSCGAGIDKKGDGLGEKKALLEQLQKQREGLNGQISKLESEIATLDPNAAAEKTRQVDVTDLQLSSFEHYIDLQGKIATENIYFVTPRGMGGQVKEIYVKQGDRVKKGQLLLKLDDAVIRQNIRQLETQLNFAKNIYERQKSLWNEGIGTEVQYLTSKNNVDNIENQIEVLKEQWNTTRVYAEVGGVAETVNIHVGEVFTGSPIAGITIVNPSSLKAMVDIPENYVAQVRKGMKAIVSVPDINQEFVTSISLIGETINVATRSFVAECKVPADARLKPNQVAIVKIMDHEAKDAMVIPVSTVQSDEKGKYVFLSVNENGKQVARKQALTVGKLYDDRIEIKEGLKVGDKLITRGYQSLYEGQLISSTTK